MKKGTPLKIEVDGTTYSVPYQGKKVSLRWARKAQQTQWEDAAELRALQQQYTKEEAPEVHGFERKKGKLVKAKGDPMAPGSTERHLDLCETILTDCDSAQLFEDLLEAGKFETLLILATSIMEAHSLTDEASLS
jgi:hypothetical protein